MRNVSKSLQPYLAALSLFFLFFNGRQPEHTGGPESRNRDFDQAWRFIRDSVAGAEDPGYDDSGWRLVDLPHDWSIEDLPNQSPGEVVGPFSKVNEGSRNGASNAHTIGGVGWYRKSFTLDSRDAGKNIVLYFEGAYTETEVWVNGKAVGSHRHGYTSFFFDITAQCRLAGEKNVIAVLVRNRGANSRWYAGSGLYRHVRLLVTDRVHVQPWGLFVTTPSVSQNQALVRVSTQFEYPAGKTGPLQIRIELYNDRGLQVGTKTTAVSCDGSGQANLVQELWVKSPRLWSPETPNLYKAVVSINANGMKLDENQTSFGIRSIRFTASEGFLLNGKPLEMRGGCVHHDNGILGAAAIDRAEERRVELLKKNGYNAVRSSHYPPSPAFLDACDRLGLLVIDEAFDMWQKPKNPQDYHLFFDQDWKTDLSAMVLRDRNHPSVVLWSIGNEIQERADSSGLAIIRRFKPVIAELDTTRPVTSAICAFWDNPGKKWSDADASFALLDVGGYNYQLSEYQKDHERAPGRIMVGTESFPNQALENWDQVETYSYVVGDFVWTAIDYLGESGIGHTSCENETDDFAKPWPWFNAWCGDIDLVGDKKPQSYFRDIVWRRRPITVAVHTPLPEGCKERVFYWGWPDEVQSWTFPGQDGRLMDINLYSRASRVRLELNGKVVGEKMIGKDDRLTASFRIPYQPGRLTAVALENGKEAGRMELQTAGRPAAIRLTPDRKQIHSSRNDLSYVRVEVVDARGLVVPNAEIPVDFALSGPATLVGVGNASPSDMASFQQPRRKTFRGVCLLILRPQGKTGTVTVQAKATGLRAASATILIKQ